MEYEATYWGGQTSMPIYDVSFVVKTVAAHTKTVRAKSQKELKQKLERIDWRKWPTDFEESELLDIQIAPTYGRK